MALPMHRVTEILWSSGCFDFVRESAERAAAEMERLRPDAFALLNADARESLRKSCCDRFEILYYQALTEDVRQRMNRFDPIHSMIISRKSIEPARKAAKALADEGGIIQRLRERYPLLEEYEQRVWKNCIDSYVEFFDALLAKRDEISARLLGGRRFTEIRRLSAGGADLHRHGRSVMGVWTDAGAFYYKPHDCGLDAVYHEIVSRWFSDCTIAPDVVEGDGFAFVTCLTQAPVQTEEGLSDYFRNFGILTALFHGLGSCDMHQENVMACGLYPSAIDIETLIVPVRKGPGKGVPQQPQAADMLDSVLRIGILPRRMYHMPLLSPLYTASDSVVSLPEYNGKRFTVEGYEPQFAEGFREGYRRIYAVRQDVKKLFEARKDVTVRCLLQNTSYYDQIRRIMLRPEYLSDKAEREKVFHRLCVPYEQNGSEINQDLVGYERSCLLQVDIPYFCTALDGIDLCGETTAQTVVPGYLRYSSLETVKQRLDGLSPAEQTYQEEVIRDAFAQAPLDVPRDKEREPIAENSIAKEDARETAASFFRQLQATVLHNPDGGILWSSAAPQLKGVRTCGPLSAIADVGAYCAWILRSPAMRAQHDEARTLAAACARRLSELIGQWAAMEQQMIVGALPAGLYGGLGGVLSACSQLAQADVPEAREAVESVLRLIEQRKAYKSRSLSAAEGTAGLLLALAETDGNQADACIRECAEWLLAEGGKPLSPQDNAGIGEALAAAYERLNDARWAKAALEAFARVREAYDPKLSGWPDSGEQLQWLANRGPHAAGIALAADRAARLLAGFDGAEALAELRALALDSLGQETALFHCDTLDEGNALMALCLTHAGQTERAGRILEAMRRRAASHGSYMVTNPGIRSFFEPSLRMGTLGVGCAAIAWLDAVDKEDVS